MSKEAMTDRPRDLLHVGCLTLIIGIALSSAPAAAVPSSCAQHFAAGGAPEIVRPALAVQVMTLCFEGYAVLHSGVSRTPLAVAEHLTRARIAAASEIRREGNFHEEQQLPADQRSRLADYARSGFDRGHMAPSGDMATTTSMAESFSLANMVPQNPSSNRCLWEGIESAVRRLAIEVSEVFVVTGPIFQGESLERIGGRVLVPTSLYKAVYVPGRGAAAYLTVNAPGLKWRGVSLSELRQIAGIDVFPDLPLAERDRQFPLPEPQPNNVGGACTKQDQVAGERPGSGTQAQGNDPAASTSPASPSRRAEASGWSRSTLLVTSLFAVVMVILLVRVLGRR